MSAEWFYNIMGDVVGPLSASELRAHAQKRRITRDTVIRKGLDGQWISADRIKGLFERDSTPPPMPPKLVSNSRGVAESNAPNIKSDGVQQPVFTMKGVQDLLEVFEDRVTISPKGVLGFLNKGIKGAKEIPFASVVAVQFKEAGAFFNGYLQFTIPGGNESKGGIMAATKDENTFMFAANNNGAANEIKDFIDKAIRKLQAPQTTTVATSLAEEIQKLAALKEQGLLSDEEFQASKHKLIG